MSSGKQMYKPNPSSFPINQPIPNLDQIYQTSGECEYTDDIPIRKNEVFCAFTIAEAPGVIEKIEFEDALVTIEFILMYVSGLFSSNTIVRKISGSQGCNKLSHLERRSREKYIHQFRSQTTNFDL